MSVLSHNFLALTCVGVWKPIRWTGIKALLYHLYTAVVSLFVFSFVLSGLMDFGILNIDLEASIDHISLVLSLVAISQKIVCMTSNRMLIIGLINFLDEDPFLPKDEYERAVQKYYDQFCRNSVLFYIILGGITIILYTVSHIFMMIPTKTLPYKGLIPLNYSNPTIYWILAISQIYAVFSAASVNAAFGAFFPSLMLQICAKIKMLIHRFQSTLNALVVMHKNKQLKMEEVDIIEQKLITKWVSNHLAVLRLFELSKWIFSAVVFVHYVITSFVLCTIAYVLSRAKMGSMNFVGNFLFFVAIMSLQFLQCISANHVTLEFSDLHNMIYDTNWYGVSNRVRRSMIIIMSKTLHPIIFASGHFVTLSLESFKHVIKVSYTIYNVLA